MSANQIRRRGDDLGSTAKDPLDRWDWSSTMFVILLVVLVVALTFELWTPHLGGH
jgi:hypothetical protein